MKATFTTFNTDNNWAEGKISDYTFQAKLYDNNSPYGINKGRVSKLSIKNSKNQKTIASYDRGWDIEPNTSDKSILNAVVTLLENSPKRFS